MQCGKEAKRGSWDGEGKEGRRGKEVWKEGQALKCDSLRRRDYGLVGQPGQAQVERRGC